MKKSKHPFGWSFGILSSGGLSLILRPQSQGFLKSCQVCGKGPDGKRFPVPVAA
jgi:hypothetical protein